MKRAKLFMAIFIIVIMVSSVIGFVSLDKKNNTQNYDYDGYTFNLDANGKYFVNINDKTFIFDYPPGDLSSITLPNFNLGNSKYYILINFLEKDENMDYSLNKLEYNLNTAGIRPVLSCINEEGCPSDVPIKDCSEDSFYFTKGNTSRIYLKDKCIVIEGSSTEMVKLVDKIDLKVAGIE